MKSNNGKESSKDMVKRVVKFSILIQVVGVVSIYLFTFQFIYSIIFLSGAVLSMLGFLVIVKMTDRVLKNGSSQGMVWLVGFLKLSVISLCFYLASRVSKGAVLYYILGLSVIMMAIALEGILQFRRSRVNGRA